MDKTCYKTSTDYKHLAELARSGKVIVGFVTYKWKFETFEQEVTDVCEIKYRHCEEDQKFCGFTVGCRGHIFFDAMNYQLKLVKGAENMTLDEYFEEMCKYEKLEYIEPTD